MQRAFLSQTARRSYLWACLGVCVAVILGGCQSKEVPLSKAAQAVKQGLLGEMARLRTPLAEPVAKQDWQAVIAILQTSYEKMEKEGKFIPARIVVLDRNGVTQVRYPPVKGGPLDFSNYEQVKTVFAKKQKIQAMLYLEGKKVFLLIAPLLQPGQVAGAVVMGFPEEELQRWEVPEKEFLSIDFNH
jgi:hypothetical protein